MTFVAQYDSGSPVISLKTYEPILLGVISSTHISEDGHILADIHVEVYEFLSWIEEKQWAMHLESLHGKPYFSVMGV